MQATNPLFQPNKLPLSEIVIIESYDIFELFNALEFEVSWNSQQEILRQAFKVLDDPQLKLGTPITTITMSAGIVTRYLVEEFSINQMVVLNDLFRKIILTIYFRCYENKLFVGSNYPTVPAFPYFLENIDLAGCVLRLDRTYF